MRKHFSVFITFFISLCAVCAFLVLALILSTVTGCTPTRNTAVSASPIPTMEPSERPSVDPPPELSEQPSGAPAQSIQPSAPSSQAIFPEIILSELSLNVPVPDFLDKDQQLLYRQAFEIYTCLFGGDTSGVCIGDEDKFPGMKETVELNGITYTKVTGRYAEWGCFDSMIHSVFTDAFWLERNADNVFVNIDGALYYLNAAKGHYYRNENFPDTFRLDSQTDNEIIFTVTGYYSSPWPYEGETSEQRNQRRKNDWEYKLDFTINLVRTADNWRFDQFYSTVADEADPETLMMG